MNSDSKYSSKFSKYSFNEKNKAPFKKRRKSDANSQLTMGSEILHKLLGNGKSPLSKQFLRWKMWKMWPQFVGHSIASVSEPVGYVKGVLYIWVKNSSWMQQMVFMKEILRVKLNEEMGFSYIDKIILTMDRKSVPSDPEEVDELKKSISQIINDGR